MSSELEQILRWPDWPGWLVLSAGVSDATSNIEMDDIRAAALTRITIDGGLAYVGVNESDHDELIEMMGDLGAPAGYFVNIMMEDDAAIREALEEAGMILLTGSIELSLLRSGLMGAAMEGILGALARGALVFAEGQAIRLLGEVVDADIPGFGLLEGALILPEIESISMVPFARDILISGAAQVAIGIGAGSALVLGPEKRIEAWGQGHVTIALGRSWK